MDNSKCDVGIITAIAPELWAINDALSINNNNCLGISGANYWQKEINTQNGIVNTVIHCISESKLPETVRFSVLILIVGLRPEGHHRFL
jgi:hypothetical protein